MPTYECNHCHKTIKNNGGNAREVGMFWVNDYTYCSDCMKKICVVILEEF